MYSTFDTNKPLPKPIERLGSIVTPLHKISISIIDSKSKCVFIYSCPTFQELNVGPIVKIGTQMGFNSIDNIHAL